ncbi:unnamed protein product, partial [marine sediment metagenome]
MMVLRRTNWEVRLILILRLPVILSGLHPIIGAPVLVDFVLGLQFHVSQYIRQDRFSGILQI